MKKSLFVFISGSSGVGKNTVIANLMEKNDNIEFLRSHTSRQPRIDDKKNVYYFVPSNAEFEKLINDGDILEFDYFNDHYYGISIKEIKSQAEKGKIIIKDLTVLGVSNVKELMKNELEIVSVFLTADKKILKDRLIKRKTDKKDIKNRLKVYKHEQNQMLSYEYVVFNNNLEKTIEKMEAIINSAQNHLPILSLQSCQQASEKKIEKLVNRLSKGKNLKPIKVVAEKGRIYLIEGINEYLAHLKTGTHINLIFTENSKNIKPDEDNISEFEKLTKLYTK